MVIDGIDITSLGEDALAKLRGEKTDSSSSSSTSFPSLTVRENVAVPMEIRGTPNAGARHGALLEEVGLSGRAHHYPSQL